MATAKWLFYPFHRVSHFLGWNEIYIGQTTRVGDVYYHGDVCAECGEMTNVDKIDSAPESYLVSTVGPVWSKEF